MAKRQNQYGKCIQAGFTLLELIVVVSIILFLTATSIAALSMFGRGSAAKHGARIVDSQLRRARQLAANARVYHFILFDQVNGRMSIYKDTPTAGPAAARFFDLATDTVVGVPVDLPKGVEFKPVAAGIGGIPPLLVVAVRPDGSMTSYPSTSPPPPGGPSVRPDLTGPVVDPVPTAMDIWPNGGWPNADLVIRQTNEDSGCVIDWSYPAGKVIKIVYCLKVQ